MSRRTRYRDIEWDVVPGMCCPIIRFFSGNTKIGEVAYDGFQAARRASQWIDDYLGGDDGG